MISIIIPANNEQENIKPLCDKLRQVLDGLKIEYEIIFIDDGSTDDTFNMLCDQQKINSRIRIIKFRKNFGQTAALSAGFRHAKGDVLVTMDCDLQNDPEDILKLLEKMEKEDFDAVCGWRFNRKDPILKNLSSRVANSMRRKITGEKIHDSGCTLRAYKKEAVNDLDLYGEMHRYIPALLSWKGYIIGEVKIAHHPRKYGRTKYNWKRLLKGFLDLIVISFWQKFSVRPIHVFGGLGLLLSITGGLLGIYMGIERVLFGSSLSDRPLFLLSIFMVIVGVQFIVSGILADIMLKVYYGQKDRKNYLIEKVVE